MSGRDFYSNIIDKGDGIYLVWMNCHKNLNYQLTEKFRKFSSVKDYLKNVFFVLISLTKGKIVYFHFILICFFDCITRQVIESCLDSGSAL